MDELTCREFIGFLDEYVAGTQDAAVRREFERHLQLCPPCVDYLRTYRHTIDLVRRTCAEQPEDAPVGAPEELVQAILAARRKHAEARRRSGPRSAEGKPL